MATGEIIGYADADYKVPIEEFDKIEPLLPRVRRGDRIPRARPRLDRTETAALSPGGIARFCRLHADRGGLRGVTDSQCGFKFFRRQAALELFRCQKIDGYMFDVEILALAHCSDIG